MSLTRFSDPRKPSGQTVLSREVLQQPRSTSTSQEDTMQEQKETMPSLDQLNQMILELAEKAGSNVEEAKRDERVVLLAAATLQMCRLLQDFTATTSAEMEKIADRELKNLNIQSQYVESVRASAVNIAREMHRQFAEEQKAAIQDGCRMLEQKAQSIESGLSICAKEVKNSAFSASETAEYLRKVSSITDLMYFAAPILVVIDIILRVIALMGHIS
jgi:hypothetical protein